MKQENLQMIEMAHGAGTRATARLIQEVFLDKFQNPWLQKLDDGAKVDLSGSLAISTDAFVVNPLFFPGGDIGKLAVCGTLNDVSMCGAVPRIVAASFILEEGFSRNALDRIVSSLSVTAKQAGVEVVTGDTKVVERGKGDGVYITTTGLGERLAGVNVSGHFAKPGDLILISGPIGDHGATIMAQRAGIDLENTLRSDCQVLSRAVTALLEQIPEVHVLRDPTRGGVTSALSEIAACSQVGIEIEQRHIPIRQATRAACEILGLDPLELACEGQMVVVTAPEEASAAQQLLRAQPECPQAQIIGRVTEEHPELVLLQTGVGGKRLLTSTEGEPLPRIC